MKRYKNDLPRQVEDEISRLFDFMEFTYGLFGFEFSLELSTRPDNYLGQVETWNEAEAVSHFPRISPHTPFPFPFSMFVLPLHLTDC